MATAEVETMAAVNNGNEAPVAMAPKGGDLRKDLPQDCINSPTSTEQIEIPVAAEKDEPKGSPAATASSANAHAWVSPNKSDEVPSSKDSSPDAEFDKASDDADAPNVDMKAEFDAEAEYAYDADSERPDLDLSIVGQRLEVLEEVASEDAVVDEDELVLMDGSKKDFVKIIHGEKVVTLVLPSDVSCKLGSTLELSESLAASLGVTDEIVGLKTTAVLLDKESMKQHGEVVIPFSALASGKLSELLEGSGTEGIPSFELVTTDFSSYLNKYRGEADDDASSSTVHEDDLYTEAFVTLMESSESFDPFEKNALLRFGIDFAKQGNILFRAAFRMTLYSGSEQLFVEALKAIAKILLNENDDQKSSTTLFSLTDFIICADELWDSSDLNSQQYITLVHAIFSGHSSVQALFDLYHNPDFLLAVDGNDDLRGELLLRDLLHLAKRDLELLRPRTPALNEAAEKEDEDVISDNDELLKHAIRLGMHNFAEGISSKPLDKEFVHIIYHMFSSGDRMVLDAVKTSLKQNNSEAVEAMLLREWKIFCRNRAFRNDGDEVDDASHDQDLASATFVRASDRYDGKSFPEPLLSAVTLLAEQGDLTDEKAARILTSFAEGNLLVREIYDQFISFGGLDDFLNMLTVMSDTDLDTLGAHDDEQVSMGKMLADAEAHVAAEKEEEVEEFLQRLLSGARADGDFAQAFGLRELELSALRLALARKNSRLFEAVANFNVGLIDISDFEMALHSVADDIVQEVAPTV